MFFKFFSDTPCAEADYPLFWEIENWLHTLYIEEWSLAYLQQLNESDLRAFVDEYLGCTGCFSRLRRLGFSYDVVAAILEKEWSHFYSYIHRKHGKAPRTMSGMESMNKEVLTSAIKHSSAFAEYIKHQMEHPATMLFETPRVHAYFDVA